MSSEHRRMRAAHAMRGFSLIEVLIAILVLSFGLLGLAMLQTMSVRYAESSNYRTQATNMAYEMLDQIRVNRINVAAYEGTYTATTSATSCVPAVGTGLTTTQYLTAWRCRLGRTLGAGATARVAQGPGEDEVTVSIIWDDERWTAGSDPLTFAATTRL